MRADSAGCATATRLSSAGAAAKKLAAVEAAGTVGAKPTVKAARLNLNGSAKRKLKKQQAASMSGMLL